MVGLRLGKSIKKAPPTGDATEFGGPSGGYPTRLSMKNLKYAIIGYDVYKLYAQALSTRKKYLITRTLFIIKGTYEQNMNRM